MFSTCTGVELIIGRGSAERISSFDSSRCAVKASSKELAFIFYDERKCMRHSVANAEQAIGLLERQVADIDGVGSDSTYVVLWAAAAVIGPATDFCKFGHYRKQLLAEHFGHTNDTG